MKIEIEKYESEIELPFYHHYQGQSQAQPAYVSLDTTSGLMWADWSGEVGTGMPANVWNGDVIRFPLNVWSTTEEANEYMEWLKSRIEDPNVGLEYMIENSDTLVQEIDFSGCTRIGDKEDLYAVLDYQFEALTRETDIAELTGEIWNDLVNGDYLLSQWVDKDEIYALLKREQEYLED